MLDVHDRYLQLATQRRALRWYALVDGLQHRRIMGDGLRCLPGMNRALFEGTEDAALADAGPWLHDLCADPAPATGWAKLERAAPAVSWLITAMDLEGLAQVLRLKLDVTLCDGRRALLRFYDPRVLSNLLVTLPEDECSAFFEAIEEWHFLSNGERVWIGRQHHA